MYKTKKPPLPQKPQPADAATAAFMKEVDEAMHEDRLKAIWDSYKYLIFGGIAAIFVFSSGWQVWQESAQNARTEAAEQLFNNASFAQLQTVKSAGIQALAIQKAAATLPATKTAELYENLNVPPHVQTLTSIHAAIALMGENPAAADLKLAALGSNTPYHATILTLRAEIAELKQEPAAALALWEQISVHPTAPASLKTQATTRASVLRTKL